MKNYNMKSEIEHSAHPDHSKNSVQDNKKVKATRQNSDLD